MFIITETSLRQHGTRLRHHSNITDTSLTQTRDITKETTRHQRDIAETPWKHHRDISKASRKQDRGRTETSWVTIFPGACGSPDRLFHVRPLTAYRNTKRGHHSCHFPDCTSESLRPKMVQQDIGRSSLEMTAQPLRMLLPFPPTTNS